jgi:hypothetical protein
VYLTPADVYGWKFPDFHVAFWVGGHPYKSDSHIFYEDKEVGKKFLDDRNRQSHIFDKAFLAHAFEALRNKNRHAEKLDLCFFSRVSGHIMRWDWRSLSALHFRQGLASNLYFGNGRFQNSIRHGKLRLKSLDFRVLVAINWFQSRQGIGSSRISCNLNPRGSHLASSRKEVGFRSDAINDAMAIGIGERMPSGR